MTSSSADPDLVSFVQLANAFGLEEDVILTLPGQVVAGTLISGHAHFEELARLVQGDEPDETLRSGLAARFRKRAEEYRTWGESSKLGDLDPEGPEGDDLRAMPDADYLHLRTASVVSPNDDELSRELPLWRGRISDVVGWTIGGYTDAPDD